MQGRNAGKVLIAAFLCFFSVLSFAAEASFFREFKGTLRMQDTPRAAFSNLNNTGVSGMRWLVVQLQYSPHIPAGREAAFYDNVTLEGAVLVDSVAPDGSARVVLFTGKTRFWSMALDNRRRTELMVIAPQMLERYMPGVTRNSDMFVARLRFIAPGNVILGEQFIGKRISEDKMRQLFIQAMGENSSVVKVDGGLFSQWQSPWAAADLDVRDLSRQETK